MASSIISGMSLSQNRERHVWSRWEKFLFRTAFVFFLLLIIPIESKWYIRLFSVKTVFAFLNTLTGYRTNFYSLHTESGKWGFGGFITWWIALGISLVVASVWSFFVRNEKREGYDNLYYWLRVIVRYRTAIGIIAFGFLKLYPMQMPKPSLSNLDANLGDYDTYKIYWQIVGVSIWYEIVLGAVEILGGILLFFRSTTAVGAVIVGGVLYNIAHANLAYDGGVHVYAGFFVLTSLFLLLQYIPALWKLLIKQQDVTPKYYYPEFHTKRKRVLFYSIKYLFVFTFTILFAILRYDVHYHVGQLKEPITPGLSGARGYYNVTEFRMNNKIIPYSPLDSVRWQSVVFEKWSTLVYKVNKAFPVSLSNGTPNPKDIDRSYELAGMAGGRKYLFYTFNEQKKQLYLQDKYSSPYQEEDNDTKPSGKKKAKEKKKLIWNYSRPTDSRIILSGLNENNDSIYVVLDRIEKDYPININRSNLSNSSN